MDGMTSEIRYWAGVQIPAKWMKCEGQYLKIIGHEALFSLLGTTYGGDGKTTFCLPDFRGRIGMAPNQTSHNHLLRRVKLGEKTGEHEVSLRVDQLPSHTHKAFVNPDPGTLNSPVNAFPASTPFSTGPKPNLLYSDFPESPMYGNIMDLAGGNAAHSNMQPTLAINHIICIDGVYPTRG